VADAAQTAQVKISCKIEHDAARLLAQDDALLSITLMLR
jgi:hypothetical protein